MKFNLITNKKQRKETFKLTYIVWREKNEIFDDDDEKKLKKCSGSNNKKIEKNILTDNRLLMKIRCI